MVSKPTSRQQEYAKIPAGQYAVGLKQTSKWWLVRANTKKDARKKIELINELPSGSNMLRFYNKLPATPKVGVV